MATYIYTDEFQFPQAELIGPTPYLRWTELDQTAPAGRWDGYLDADVLRFRRATGSVADPWSSSEEWLNFDKPNAVLVFNEGGADLNARFEGDTDANLIFLDAGNNRVGIGTATPGYKLSVSGEFEVVGTTPILYLTESDQTDPAGRFRLRVTADELQLERAASANWATTTRYLQVNSSSAAFASTPTLTDPTWGTITWFGSDALAFTSTNTGGITGLTAQTSIGAANTADWTGGDVDNGLVALAAYLDISASATGTISYAAAIAAYDGAMNAMTITNLSRVWIDATYTAAATVTNNYGLFIVGASGGATINRAIYVAAGTSEFLGTVNLNDNVLLALGTGNDIVGVNVSAGIAANTAISNVLVGTVVGPALAANSFAGSNITASGDYALYGNRGGNSEAFLWYDSSAGVTHLYSAGAAMQVHADVAFQQATTISTTTTNLTLAPAGVAIIKAAAATTTDLFRVQNSGGGGGWAFGTQTQTSAALDFSIQNWDTITITGADPTTHVSMTILRLQGFTFTATNPNQTVTDARTLFIAGSSVNDSGGATPTLTRSTSLYITEPQAGTTKYSIWVDTGMSRFDENVLIGFTAAPSNVTGAVALVSGGIAFTDVANAWIDDATHGDGTVVHYIGNNTIDTTASARIWKENLAPVNGGARQHLTLLSGLLQEYDYKSGEGHFIGLVAEDVREVLPQYVVGVDTPSLRYQYMVGPLLWGWQEHEARFSTVEERLGAVEEANRILRGQLVKAGFVPEV